jgi:hypothetical protein
MSGSEYYRRQEDDLKRLMGASDLHYDLVGAKLTIDDQPLFIPYEAVRAMSSLLHNHEAELVEELRRKMAAERSRTY